MGFHFDILEQSLGLPFSGTLSKDSGGLKNSEMNTDRLCI